jgi:hypothetical protein
MRLLVCSGARGEGSGVVDLCGFAIIARVFAVVRVHYEGRNGHKNNISATTSAYCIIEAR